MPLVRASLGNWEMAKPVSFGNNFAYEDRAHRICSGERLLKGGKIGYDVEVPPSRSPN